MSFDLLIIDILIIQLVLLVVEIIEGLVLGDQGEKGFLVDYYMDLRGEEKPKKPSLFKTLQTKLSGNQTISKKATYIYMICGSLAAYGFGIVFFQNHKAAFIVALGGVFVPRYVVSNIRQKRLDLLNRQLKETLQSIANSLRAGTSLPVAFERSLEDMGRVLANDRDKPIIDELELIVYQLKMGHPMEDVLFQFRQRVDIEDVRDFVSATLITKQKGGNLAEVMTNVAQTIADKITIKNEIAVLTAGKRAEAKMLTFSPIGLVLFLELTSPDYMAPMHNTGIGLVLMVTGLVLLTVNWFVGKKIVDIKI